MHCTRDMRFVVRSDCEWDVLGYGLGGGQDGDLAGTFEYVGKVGKVMVRDVA